LDYRQHIQPIFDRHCVECHGQKDPAGGLEFSSREIGGFAQSYRTLHCLKPGDPTPINERDIHSALHPEAVDDAYVEKRRGDGGAMDIIKRMERNEWPNMLVSISNRHDDASITMPLQFGSNKSKLIRTLLDHPKHQAVRQKMGEEDWLLLVTWVDYNAYYHGTLMDKSKYRKENKVTRVPFYLPSPWVPADLNPSFFNTKDISIVPELAEAVLP
jgi:hypothetical protein